MPVPPNGTGGYPDDEDDEDEDDDDDLDPNPDDDDNDEPPARARRRDTRGGQQQMSGQPVPVQGDDVVKAIRLGTRDFLTEVLAPEIEAIKKSVADLYPYIGNQTNAVNDVMARVADLEGSVGSLQKSVAPLVEELPVVKALSLDLSKALGGSPASSGTSVPSGTTLPSDVLRKAGLGTGEPLGGGAGSNSYTDEQQALLQKAVLATQLRKATEPVAEIASRHYAGESITDADFDTLTKALGGSQ